MGIPMLGLVEIIILVLVLGAVVVMIGSGAKRFRLPKFGHVMLECPHCQAETPADRPVCAQCGKELSG